MRSMSKRAFWRDHPTEETVQVTHGGQIIGTFVPVGVETPDSMQLAAASVAYVASPSAPPPTTDVLPVRAKAPAPAPAMGTRVPIAGMTQAERDKVLGRMGKA